jgi:hypothetical protein
MPDDNPELRHWVPGTELPELGYKHHLSRRHVRAIQRLAHALLLPLLDRCRPAWSEHDYPQRIPPGIVAQLDAMLSATRASADANATNL